MAPAAQWTYPYVNPLAEAEGTARRIRQYAQAGFAFEDMAVLFRTGNGRGFWRKS